MLRNLAILKMMQNNPTLNFVVDLELFNPDISSFLNKESLITNYLNYGLSKIVI